MRGSLVLFSKHLVVMISTTRADTVNQCLKMMETQNPKPRTPKPLTPGRVNPKHNSQEVFAALAVVGGRSTTPTLKATKWSRMDPQTFHNPLIKEHTLNYGRIPSII